MSNRTAKLARRVVKKAAMRQTGLIAQGQIRELLKASFWIRLKFALRVLRGR
jgi:hypothetical protein